jgi:hypothetical protein
MKEIQEKSICGPKGHLDWRGFTACSSSKNCSKGSPRIRLPQLEAYWKHPSSTEVHNRRRLFFTLLTHRQYEMFGYKTISCSTPVSFTSDVQNGLQVAQPSERTLQNVFSYRLQNAKTLNTRSWNACCGLYHVPRTNPVHGTRDHNSVTFFFLYYPHWERSL